MPTTDQTILLAILEHPNTSFRKLQSKTGISPRILRTHLDDLDTRGLVHQEKPKGVKDTHHPAYPSTLTKKGINYVLDERFFNDFWREVAGPLKILQNLTARIAQDPKKLSWLRQYLRQPAEEDARRLDDGTLTPEEWVERTVQRVEQRAKDDPLRESFKAIRDIFLKVNFLPHEIPKEGFAVAILEDGSVYLKPIALLRKQGSFKEARKGA